MIISQTTSPVEIREILEGLIIGLLLQSVLVIKYSLEHFSRTIVDLLRGKKHIRFIITLPAKEIC